MTKGQKIQEVARMLKQQGMEWNSAQREASKIAKRKIAEIAKDIIRRNPQETNVEEKATIIYCEGSEGFVDSDGNILITMESLKSVSAYLHNVGVVFKESLSEKEKANLEKMSEFLWNFAMDE